MKKAVVAVIVSIVLMTQPSAARAAMASFGNNPCVAGCLFSVFMTGAIIHTVIESGGHYCGRGGWTPVQIALFAPVQVYNRNDCVYGLRANLFYGNNSQVAGVDTGLVNVSDESCGILIAGLANVSYSRAGIIQVAGIFNATRRMTGIQAAGIINVADRMSGIQAALVWNYAEVQVSGIQASLFNSAKSLQGMQVGAVNGVFQEAVGMQLALICNYDGGRTQEGFDSLVQVACLLNSAHGVSGGQVGLINYAVRVRGFQIGVINWAKRMVGVQIGLVNVIEDNPLPFFPLVNFSTAMSL